MGPFPPGSISAGFRRNDYRESLVRKRIVRVLGVVSSPFLQFAMGNKSYCRRDSYISGQQRNPL
jgi:hypothetical protein